MAGFNPLKLMQIKNAWEQFGGRHPKFAAFLQFIAKEGFKEGTVIEITIRTPEEKEISSNIRIMREDVEMINSFRE